MAGMRVAVTGASGLIGTALTTHLRTRGDEVVSFVRRRPRSPAERPWEPTPGGMDPAHLADIDAVVHLAGAGVGAKRWTAAYKKKILHSRVDGTTAVAEAIAAADRPIRLVSGSAVGFYGDRGDEALDETSAAGQGFLAEVCQAWEAATKPASEAGIRTVNLRFGVILSGSGGALGKMLLPFQLGAGGRIGGGRQWMSWVALDDMIGAIHHALLTDTVAGPVNVVSPTPVTNAEFTKTLGRVLLRPTIFPMPAFAAKLALGEMAEELLLAGQRVLPKRLEAANYRFRFNDLEDALRHVLGRVRP